MKIVHGKSRHPQAQGSVERANGVCKIQLQRWMEDNQSAKWSLGLKFVQKAKNNSNHQTINLYSMMLFFFASNPVECLFRLHMLKREKRKLHISRRSYFIITHVKV